MKFKPENHIVGKVYDLTQENMQAMIKYIEFQTRCIGSLESLVKALDDNSTHIKPQNSILEDIVNE